MNATPESTSLSRLSDHEWNILNSRWARGVDHFVSKVGRKWAASEAFGNFPLFATKQAAYDAVTQLVLWESAIRAKRRSAALSGAR